MTTLDAVGSKRGYLLPYHRMLADYSPELLAAYDAFYSKLTLQENVLPPREKEIVWIALLAAAREGVGSLHLKRGIAAGLSLAEMQAAVALSAASEAFTATAFAAKYWDEWTPPESMLAAYRAFVETARGPIEPRVTELALIVCHASRKDEAPMRHHLQQFFALGGTVPQVAEGLSFMFLPIGANMLIDAVEIWERAAADLGLPPPYASAAAV